jgi:hypothetical protein
MTIADHHNLSLIPTCNVSSDANVVAIVFHWSHVTDLSTWRSLARFGKKGPKVNASIAAHGVPTSHGEFVCAHIPKTNCMMDIWRRQSNIRCVVVNIPQTLTSAPCRQL